MRWCLKSMLQGSLARLLKLQFALPLVCLAALVLIACEKQPPEPILIGFVGTLSGHNATIGTNCRDATLFAIENLNKAGGIDGRQVKLLIQDIRNDAGTGKKAVQKLIDQRVVAIIGPMFSSMAVALAPVASRSETILISPTAGTTQLNGLDDNMLRLYPGSDVTSENLARYIIAHHYRRVAIVRDRVNGAFTKDWEQLFSLKFPALGGTIIAAENYESGQESLFEVMSRALKKAPEAVLILADPIETALLCQQLPKLGKSPAIFATEWSLSPELVADGGRAVEGIRVFHAVDINSAEPLFLDFKKRYFNRFMQQPTFPAILTYDATTIVLGALKAGVRDGSMLKKHLMQQESIKLLQTSIRFDRYGDVQRRFFLISVQDGKFVTLDRE